MEDEVQSEPELDWASLSQQEQELDEVSVLLLQEDGSSSGVQQSESDDELDELDEVGELDELDELEELGELDELDPLE